MSDSAILKSLANRQVLVVEDEYVIADDMKHALEAAGAVVLGPASDVENALEIIRTATVDAAILDVNLGGEPVWPIADALRERGVRFVFATGYDQSAIPRPYANIPRCEKPIRLELVDGALAG